MAVLLRLAEEPGEIVSKEAIFHAVWPDCYVGENVLPVAIRTLRKSLGDDARNPAFIETVPRVGYRLLVSAKRQSMSDTEATEAAGESPSVTRPRHSGRLASTIGSLVALMAAAVVVTVLAAGGDEPVLGPIAIDIEPIRVEGNDPDLGALAARVTDQLIATLSRAPIARPRLLGPGAGHDGTFLVSGTAYRTADQVIMHVRLSHRGSGDILWSPIYQVTEADLASLPERVGQTFRLGALPALRRAPESISAETPRR